jgi:DivIVA domain-containing protein
MPARPLSPDDLRTATFARVTFGRRGLDEYAVAQYLDRVADEIAARDDAVARLTTETRTLKHALREWHRQMVGYDGVDLVALAQQEVEEQIAQTEIYTREREQEAARLYDQLLSEAHDRADEQLRADHHEQTLNQRNLVGAVLQGLEALATQVDATLQAFTTEVDKMGLLDDLGADDGLGMGPGDGPDPFGDAFGSDPLSPYSHEPLGPMGGHGGAQERSRARVDRMLDDPTLPGPLPGRGPGPGPGPGPDLGPMM